MKVIYPNGEVRNTEGKEALEILRHSAAHLLAQAVKRLYPKAKMGYGPANENGFYYDIDFGEEKLSEENLSIIEKEMKKAVKENLPVKPFMLSRSEAVSLMRERGEDYKVEHISDLPPESEISFYRQGDYIDMCRGPHVAYTNVLKVFKLTGISGAYWKNDSRNKMLTRIYGTAFFTKGELERYLEMLEEAEKRDHRRIGKEMELFMLSEEGLG
ncbi:MAG: threonine--tRNA ligase, partial [Ruminiclostridium sp.]|nr:threonine--tRNA ligase [Ruminiclostridium sp.]